MSDLDASFQQAQIDVKTLTTKPSNDDLLSLYSLYKQGSNGDVTGKRPGRLDMVNRAKYDAWAKLEGTDQDSAKQSYVDLVDRLLGR
ncbi:acyl-CoA-binding protein [Rhodococcus sp. Eu-32]|uniref:acyl-CoA-binding protein n=1 Tax=Rhodococcus sp. Eu-32 TaxID=1017319 RepID=UPI000DF33D94|nr:acyl-CoA-binding protein [Rhodococcus sp. Eu-32]RRQ27879.1 acyl-CoA-binding protein [Rhodococcus sp. Eu-32]